MSVIRKMELYCEKCDEVYEVPVILSTNSWMLEKDPELKRRAEDGTLFKNFCPVCNSELKKSKVEQ